MKRKVNLVGNTTLTISLPSKWAKKQNIGKGDEIDVEEVGRELVVSTKKEQQSESVEIHIPEVKPIMKRAIHALYKIGYDEIKIILDNPKRAVDIQNLVKEDMVGIDIVKQEKDYCIIKSIAGIYEKEFDNILRRTFLLLKSMLSNIIEALKTSDSDLLENIKSMEKTNNRTTGICRRILNKKGYKEYKKTNFMYYIVIELERMADELKFLCEYLSNKKTKTVDKEVIKLYSKLFDLYNGCYENFYKYNQSNLVRLYEIKNEIIEKAYKLMEKSNNARPMHHLVAITQIIANILSTELKIAYV